ncbi:MAG: 3-isopropylmalate dehydratase small subunit [Lentisphaeria bacterium]|nr:3-isopropylmalate dehydratase small subunit [Lentisphaeria bacterium]
MNDTIIEKISGTAVPLRGDDIDTDRIIPARYLRCVTFDGLGEHAFEDDRKQDPDHPFNQERFDGAAILIVGRNFGCGSSREHAPQSLYKWGIKGVIGQSFAEIFFGNCNAMGMPCMTVDADTCEALFVAAEADSPPNFEIDVSGGTIRFGDRSVQGGIPDGPRESFLAGTWNATAVLLEAADHVDEVASKLPYIKGF